MFVKRRDVSLWWGFYNLHDTIGMDDGVMNELRSPSVAELNARKINSVALLYLTNEDAITNYNGVMGVDSGASRTSSTSSGGGLKAFATREGKECHSHNQYQGESQ
jgi:hypothetical protein